MMDRKDDKNKSIKNTIPKLGVFLSQVTVGSDVAVRRLGYCSIHDSMEQCKSNRAVVGSDSLFKASEGRT
jgi:hypothetical protein